MRSIVEVEQHNRLISFVDFNRPLIPFLTFENLICMYSLKIREKMDSLPAWWTFFWPPGFSQTNIFFAWPDIRSFLRKNE